MSTLDRMQHAVENFSIFFQGGVRRSILIFLGMCVLFSIPVYYGGQLTSRLTRDLWLEQELPINPKEFTFNPLTYGNTQIAKLINEEQDLYLSVDNKANRTVGFYPFAYTVQILDETGKVIQEERRQHYILPQDTLVITIRDKSGIGETLAVQETNQTRPIDFNPLANPLQTTPNIEVLNQRVRSISEDQYEISALFNNQDKQRVEKVDVTYLVRNEAQEVIGTGTGSFNGLNPEETREFLAVHPKHESQAARFVEIRWSVNYLDEDTLSF